MDARTLITAATPALAAAALLAVGPSRDRQVDRAERHASAPAALIDRGHGLLVPRHLSVDRGLTASRARLAVLRAQQLYTFWDTGHARFLRYAVVPGFHDHTPPPGRGQGRRGVLAASAEFRAAVPDLHCELADLAIAADRITARQVYRGHFTGTYQGVQGAGQTIRFNAIDIQQLGADRIVGDWHLEDNAALLAQFGFATAPA